MKKHANLAVKDAVSDIDVKICKRDGGTSGSLPMPESDILVTADCGNDRNPSYDGGNQGGKGHCPRKQGDTGNSGSSDHA